MTISPTEPRTPYDHSPVDLSEDIPCSDESSCQEDPGANRSDRFILCRERSSARLVRAASTAMTESLGQSSPPALLDAACVCRSLTSIFTNRSLKPLSSGDDIKSTKLLSEISVYIRENFEKMVQRAQKDPTGGFSISKAKTGLSYTLRCFCSKETKEVSFHISFGMLNDVGSGTEAIVKKIFLIDLNGYEAKAQRAAKKCQKGGEPWPIGLSPQEREEKANPLIQRLIANGVTGILMQTPLSYTGKRGVKKASLSPLHPGDLLEASSCVLLPETKKKILSHLVQTVTSMHKNGVVHRDLKPENIVLAKDGTPYVGDFSFALEINERSPLSGTLGWSPPEIINARQGETRATTANDLWSLGAVMFTVMTGTAPLLGPGEGPPFPHFAHGGFTPCLRILLGLLRSQKTPESAISATDSSLPVTPRIAQYLDEVREQYPYRIRTYIKPSLAQIIAGLLEEDPEQRMTDDQLLEAWSTLPPETFDI